MLGGEMRNSPAFKHSLFLSSFLLLAFSKASEVKAELRDWSGSASLSSVGSITDRVLWNLRPEIALQFTRGFSSIKGLNFDLQVRGRADTQSRFETNGRHVDTRVDRLAFELLGSQTSLAVGLQKWSWGEPTSFDGVDVVSAQDLSEPLYSDRELVKLAAPALTFQFLGDNSIFQLIWVVMAQRSPVPESVESLEVVAPRPLRFGKDMEFAIKAGGLTRSGWDINGYWASHLERIPQLVLGMGTSARMLQLYEPRVLTIGLTSTQSFGDAVVRFEFAQHSDRAVPLAGLIQQESATQLVIQTGVDWNVGSLLTLTGEMVAERWGRESSEGFVRASEYGSFGLRKTFNDGEVEVQLNSLLSFQLSETLSSAKVVWKLLDDWQWDASINIARTSIGRPLARRQLKDLVRSEVSYRF